MKKIIIIEGVDRVGKSTLCEKIKEKLPCYTFSENRDNIDFSNLKAGQVTRQQHQLLSKLERNKIYIFDRFHISEAVYGYLKRNYDIIKDRKFFESIDNRLADMAAVLIYVMPTNIKEAEERHGCSLNEDLKIFSHFVSESKMQKIFCDYDSFENPELYELICNMIGGSQNEICRYI